RDVGPCDPRGPTSCSAGAGCALDGYRRSRSDSEPTRHQRREDEMRRVRFTVAAAIGLLCLLSSAPTMAGAAPAANRQATRSVTATGRSTVKPPPLSADQVS